MGFVLPGFTAVGARLALPLKANSIRSLFLIASRSRYRRQLWRQLLWLLIIGLMGIGYAELRNGVLENIDAVLLLFNLTVRTIKLIH